MSKPTKHFGKWRIRWVDERGNRSSEVYENFADALLNLQRHQVEVAEIQRGLREPIVPNKFFAELAAYWMEQRAIHKRSGKDDESILRAHLLPVFGKLRLDQIRVSTIDEFRASRGHLNPKTVANHLTLLISMLNLAKELGWLRFVPRIRKPRVRAVSSDYKYLRSDEDVRRFLEAAREEGQVPYYLYATAIFTGLRAGELAGLRWEDIDFDRQLLTVQRSYGGPTKAADVRYVLLLDRLAPLLREWRLKNPCCYVFPTIRGTRLSPSARIFQEQFQRTLARAGIQYPSDARRGGRLVFHGLRHTFASHWVVKGGDMFKLQQLLGHKTMTMTQRYSHLCPSAFGGDHARFGSAEHQGEVLRFKQR